MTRIAEAVAPAVDAGPDAPLPDLADEVATATRAYLAAPAEQPALTGPLPTEVSGLGPRGGRGGHAGDGGAG